MPADREFDNFGVENSTMSLEKDINQKSFRSEHQKGIVNLIYTYNWVVERLRHLFDEEELTLQQYNILRILRGSFPHPLSTLQIRARMLDKMSDTSRIVDRLILKGLATKKICPTDKRLVDVCITDKGKQLLEKMDAHNASMDEIVSKLDVEDIKRLNVLLDKLRGSQ
jgi:DNA-binding MarR family transcriptional regulator